MVAVSVEPELGPVSCSRSGIAFAVRAIQFSDHIHADFRSEHFVFCYAQTDNEQRNLLIF